MEDLIKKCVEDHNYVWPVYNERCLHWDGNRWNFSKGDLVYRRDFEDYVFKLGKPMKYRDATIVEVEEKSLVEKILENATVLEEVGTAIKARIKDKVYLIPGIGEIKGLEFLNTKEASELRVKLRELNKDTLQQKRRDFMRYLCE